MPIVLYRKYRPFGFNEVVGQNHIIKTLKNAVASSRVAHAYMFTGPRGTGKTSVARILAKAVNCENVKNGEPCNKCSVCLGINQGNFLDLIEIDAASHTGVDNIRELIEKIRFAPSAAKYKVYIIDEAHMLSKGAFNALLKTLEEPPVHAIFILATTEVHKVPATILSRCQRFDFKRLSVAEIVDKLAKISEQEKVKVDKKALELIALNAGGGMRDAESLLGQIFSLEDKEVTLEETQIILGAADLTAAAEMVSFLAEQKYEAGLELISQINNDGYDLEQFGKSLIDYLRKAILLKVNPAFSKNLSSEMTEEQIKEAENLANKIPVARLVKMIKLFIEAQKEIKLAVIPQLPLELAIAELDIFDNGSKNSGDREDHPIKKIKEKTAEVISESLKTSGQFIKKTVPGAVGSAVKKIKSEKNNESLKDNKSPEKSSKKNEANAKSAVEENLNSNWNLEEVKDDWDEILEKVKPRNHSITVFLKTCQPAAVEEKKLIIANKYTFHLERLRERSNIKIIEDVIGEMFKLKPEIKFISEKEAEEMGYDLEFKPVKEEPASDSDQKQENLVSSALEIFGGKVV